MRSPAVGLRPLLPELLATHAGFGDPGEQVRAIAGLQSKRGFMAEHYPKQSVSAPRSLLARSAAKMHDSNRYQVGPSGFCKGSYLSRSERSRLGCGDVSALSGLRMIQSVS